MLRILQGNWLTFVAECRLHGQFEASDTARICADDLGAAVIRAEEQEDKPRVTRASVWTTRDGTRIKLKDMSTAHINNVIRLHAKGKLHIPDTWLASFLREQTRREQQEV